MISRFDTFYFPLISQKEDGNRKISNNAHILRGWSSFVNSYLQSLKDKSLLDRRCLKIICKYNYAVGLYDI